METVINLPEKVAEETPKGDFFVIDTDSDSYEGPYETEEQAQQEALAWFRDICDEPTANYIIAKVVRRLRISANPTIEVVG